MACVHAASGAVTSPNRLSCTLEHIAATQAHFESSYVTIRVTARRWGITLAASRWRVLGLRGAIAGHPTRLCDARSCAAPASHVPPGSPDKPAGVSLRSRFGDMRGSLKNAPGSHLAHRRQRAQIVYNTNLRLSKVRVYHKRSGKDA